LPRLHRQAVFFDHVDKLGDLIGLRLSLARLQAERPRDFGMAIYMMAAADAAQPEPKRLDEAAELSEPDIPQIARSQPIPQLLTA
jgi:hypothetical protein